MRQIIKDWISFCEEGTNFEDGYFYTMFMENVTEEEVKAIFSYFPNSEKLVENMRKYFSIETRTFNTPSEKRKELEKLIIRDFEERDSVLKNIDEFSSSDWKPVFNFIEDVNSVKEQVLDDELTQSFHDFMFDQTVISDKKEYELSNALYGLTVDFDYQLFLMIPLLNTNYSGESLFLFKRLGGVYAINDEHVVYSFE